MMNTLATVADADAYNQLSIKRLIRTLSLSQGDFTLILAHCNYQELQASIVQLLRERCGLAIAEMTLTCHEQTLFSAAQRHLATASQPEALMVFGLNRLTNLDQVLKATNLVRDEFRKQFPFPVVLWVNNDVLRQMIRLAPDFQNWSTTMDFQLATSQVLAALKDRDASLFNSLLQEGGGQFMPNARIFGAQYQRELSAAIQDLDQRKEILSEDLAGTLAFVNGREAQANASKARNLDRALDLYHQALEYYQKSLDGWSHSSDLKRRGCALYHMGIVWVSKGERDRAQHEACYKTALTYFWKCIHTFAQMQRPDYEARFINVLCFTLQRLNQRPGSHQPQWDELQNWAGRSLSLQQQFQDQFRMARAYGFLAEVAIARQQWTEAKELAEQAQTILEAELHNPDAGMASNTAVNLKWERYFHQGWYLLALGRATLALGDTNAAIQHFKKAKRETKPDYDPELYIRILNQLKNIYFEQEDYRMAFKLRQRRRAIEYQYNFRAFVGAGHLQPKHQITNPAIAPRSASNTPSIPSDFQTSGRQDDIESLVGRIASTNHRLTIIYGQSGVGKSSMLEAGLVPILLYNPIGTRDVMPIFQQVYTDADWDRSLFRSLQKSLKKFEQVQLDATRSSQDETDFDTDSDLEVEQRESSIRVKAEPKETSTQRNSSLESSDPDMVELILEQLRWNSQHDIVTVLLFDQFEEFFFVCTQKRDRLRFYEFLKVCLNLSFVNVMISLREDYLHRLLEITRDLDLDVINNDILSRQILHHIGNFSQSRARTVIRKLTENTPFQFPEELIQRLVDDLSMETGDVSPIELQIVGTQMQTDRITTLHNYEEKGPKVQLVQRYLNDALTNCGAENVQVAHNLLYCLTDENQMRPLKTLTELADDSGAESHQVDLILDILVGTGIVVKFPESSTHYYQLVHDYLVPFIRSDREPNLLARLKLTKSQLNQAWKQEAQERLRAELAEVKALNALSRALLLSHNHLNALLKGLEAAQKLITVSQTHDGNNPALIQLERDTINRLRHTLGQVKEVNRLEGHDAKGFGIAIHPDGQRLASGSADHTVRIWGVNGEAIAACEGHRDQVFGVAFSPDGKFLASASADKTVKLWPSTGKIPIRTFSGHTDTVYRVAFHPHQPLLASASHDGKICLWNIGGGLAHTFQRGIAVFNLAFSPDGRAIAAGYRDGKIRIWRLDGTFVQEMKAHDRQVYGIQYSADGHALISASGDGTVKRWGKVGTHALSHTTKGDILYRSNIPILDVQVSPDSQLVGTTTSDGVVRLTTQNGAMVQTFQGHHGNVYGLCFSPDGRLLASTGDDKTIRLWNLDGIGLHVAQGHRGRIISAAFSFRNSSPSSRHSPSRNSLPDSMGQLATAGEDCTVKLWQMDGTLLKTFHGHQDLVRQVCFSPDAQYLASASNDGTVKVWHRDGNLIQTFTHHYGGVRDVCFSQDGQSLVSAGHDRIVRLWSLSSPTAEDRGNPEGYATNQPTEFQPTEFHGARARVLSVAMSPDGQVIVGASGRSVILWRTQPGDQSASGDTHSAQENQRSQDHRVDKAGQDLRSESCGQHHLPHAHNARVLSVCFSPDGQYLATAGADKVIKLWRRNGTWLRTFRGHQATVRQVCFSPDGQYLISYGSDRTVRVWHQDGTLVRTLRGHIGTICGVALDISTSLVPDASSTSTSTSGSMEPRILSVGESAVVKGWQIDLSTHRPAAAGATADGLAKTSSKSPDLPNLASDSAASITSSGASNSKATPDLSQGEASDLKAWEQPCIEFVLDAKQSILLSDDPNANLDQLVQQGCRWLQNYLAHNPCLSEGDRQCCP